MKNGLRRIQFYLSEESYAKILPEIQSSGLTESAFCSEKIAGAKLSSRGAPAGNQNKRGKYKIAASSNRINSLIATVKKPANVEAEAEKKVAVIINNESYIDGLHRTGVNDLAFEKSDRETSRETDGALFGDESGASQPINSENNPRLISPEEIDALIDNIDEILCQIKTRSSEKNFEFGKTADSDAFDSTVSIGDTKALSTNEIPKDKRQATEELLKPKPQPLKQISLFDIPCMKAID